MSLPPPPRSTSIHDILGELRAAGLAEREKGDRFERLMVSFLTTDPMYAQRYARVWRWAEWPDCPNKQDAGIDLVAEERDTGDLCAIQCKFFDPAHTLQKADIDSFFTASGKAAFASRMIISTTDRWSMHAEEALEGQRIPVTRVRVQDLDASTIDWSQFSLARPDKLVQRSRRQLHHHQLIAMEKVITGFTTHDRGKLIMACGTGKTFTSLRIAEEMVPAGGAILFLAPSISLVSQSLKEWSNEASVRLRTFAVCSDVKAGRRTESEDIGPYDLAYPATTDSTKLRMQLSAPHDASVRTVVFSTYQSIQVVADAQRRGLPAFDLIICDEAHRTTGVTLASEDESAFVRVHDPDFLRARRRLYMTATPRIYQESAKGQAKEQNAILCSMDDETMYGPEFHRLGFGEAVEKGLLCDYKVLVFAVDEEYVSKVFQKQFAARDSELRLEDAAKIVGCWNGLAKRRVSDQTVAEDPRPMQRAVAFTRSIKDSKRIERLFTEIVTQYVHDESDDTALRCDVRHVDGTFNALVRNERLDWLRSPMPEGTPTCRILTNARCLSEGVDVPNLDAVLFLNPRNSVVDVVQSVGRVMRLHPEKRYGYVILPIGVPAHLTPEEALRDNQKYRVVWQVLQALRAHDDRFNALVNKIELNRNRDDQLQIIGVGETGDEEDRPAQTVLPFPQINEWRDAIYAKIVQKVGDRRYWEDWAQDVARIAERHTARIRALLADSEATPARKFARFVGALRRTLNPSISDDDAVNMLAQHLVTRPVFEALFSSSTFAASNPVSSAMQGMLDELEKHNIEREADSLAGFYESVRLRAEGIDNAAGKQQIIADLYERFFRVAFPNVAASLGIVYTPVEIVDFIIHSVESVLRSEFGASLADSGVHVLDPFTGTGTFIVRLLQSGLVPPERVPDKYIHELHANEIVLLAYYIAAVNIEAAYHDLSREEYRAFPGIVLTDTFQMFERGDTMDELFFGKNEERARRQKQADIRVVITNPPYSVGQSSENDANKNIRYPTLDERIRSTYAARSKAGLKRNLYDSYIRAFRWASDRIGNRGVLGFVSNGAYIDAGSADGFRLSLADEFSAIWCFNLRGNQRTAGETSRREGGKVFGQGSRTPIAITVLVKNPDARYPCRLHYHDIGDYLSRDEKLCQVREFGSIEGVPWEVLAPNVAGDWINLRDGVFAGFVSLGDKKGGGEAIFDVYSQGVLTARDAWAYDFSRTTLLAKMTRMVAFYNDQVERFGPWLTEHREQRTPAAVERFVDRDPARISWTRNLKGDLRKAKAAAFQPDAAVVSMYRPFCKQWLYFDRQLNEMVYQLPRLFPSPWHGNQVIAVTGAGATAGFSALITNAVPNYHLQDTGQCFPLYHYERPDVGGLFTADDSDGFIRHDAISDRALDTYRQRYGSSLTKDDIFHYVYGLLHSPEYRQRFAGDLRKMIPRIPMVEDFTAFRDAGLELAEWHLGYESVPPWNLDGLPTGVLSPEEGRVLKMRFAKNGSREDRSAIIVNHRVTLQGIPEEVYRYQVNGRSALEWVMERYQVRTDKASRILSDPNSWSEDPRYIIDLVARLVRVSMETLRIVDGLPALGDLDASREAVVAAPHLTLVPPESPRVAAEAYRGLLPVYSLEAAAGYFGEGRAVEIDGWTEVHQSKALSADMFVARAVGRSMEPVIHDGDYLIFRAHPAGSRQGKIVLARGAFTDPELGGPFTLKKYSSEKVTDVETGWTHSRITLSPLNMEFDPIHLDADREGDGGVQVVAEFIDKLTH
jgi:predicted helicase